MTASVPDLPRPRLEGRAAIVTGGASGIGRATALRLAAEGASVLAVDVADAVGSVPDDLPAGASGAVVPLVADVSREDDARRIVATAVERFGGLDGLANMAGILRTAHTHEASLEMWEQVLAVNLTGTFLLCREAIPHLLEREGRPGQGAIVNCSSTSTFFGHPWMAAYAASKGGIDSLTHTLAVEYAKRGLRVNAVAPGSVDTGITRGITFPEGADLKLLHRIMSPTGAGRPEHVAAVVAMLLSDDAPHLTGETIRIDGGTHA